MRTNDARLSLLLFTLLCLCACNHKPYPQALAIADSLICTKPDSAMAVLKSLKTSIQKAPEATQMYYQLLCIKANDKAYILHTSDSLIRPVLDYYIEKEDKRHLPEVYYYAGRVYRDLKDAPQALGYFEKAIEVLPKDGDYKLKSKIYSQMGTLFLYQGLYNEALELFKKGYTCDAILKDSVGMIYDLRDIASACRNIDKQDSALYYYQTAYKLGEVLQRQDLMSMVQSQIASLYILLKKYDSAKLVLQDALINIKHSNKSGIYSIAAKLYHNTGMTDSASYYYEALLDFGTIYAKERAHRSLAEIAIKTGNCQLALQHFQAFSLCADSIQKITYTESLHRMYSLYNYQLREKENYRLKAENQKKTQYIIYGLATFIIVTAFFFAQRQFSKRKRQQLKLQLQNAKQAEEKIYKKSRQFIEDNNARIRELEKKLDSAASINETLRKELQVQKELLYHEARQAEIEQDRQEQASSVLFDSEIHKLLRKRLLDPQGKIFVTANEWVEIENVLKEIYPDFFPKLDDIYRFNEYELHVCMLIKVKFSPSEIAKLVERPKETITSTRRRLYERVFQKKGNPSNWDDFIFSL